MAAVLEKGIASKLQNSFRATPGVTPQQAQAFQGLLGELQRAGVSEAEAERQLRAWAGKAPKHAVLVVKSAVLGSTYMRTVRPDSWLVRAFEAAGTT